jgi:hypothetical protein
MAGPAIVEVIGAKALRKDINRLTADQRSPLYAAMRAAGAAAVAPILPAARAALPVSERPAGRWHRPGRLAASVRVGATRTGAGVRMGSKAVPYAGWVEFGGRRHRPHDSARPFVKDGRYLFPAAMALAPRAASDYADALTRIFGSSGVWTNTGTGGVHD